MTDRSRFRRQGRALLLAGAAGALTVGSLVAAVSAGPAKAATQGPCDIYSSGGTPCVAAHNNGGTNQQWHVP